MTLSLRSTAVLVALLWTGTAGAQDIVGVEFFSGDLLRLDPGTGAGAVVGPIGYDRLNSMAKDSAGTIYSATDDPDGNDCLIRIDPTTGLGTLVVETDHDRINGMAFGPGDKLYVSSLSTFGIYELDVTTGTSTYLGNQFCSSPLGLAWGNGRLYGWALGVGLYEFDVSTGICTDVNPAVGSGNVNIQCLAFDDGGNLYGAQQSLYSIDLVTGVPTWVGVGGYGDLRGIEFLEPGPTFGTYCTAKPNTCGGLPAIGKSGISSATASGGFVVYLSGVGFGERASLLYTAGGANNAPFQGGTLCVKGSVNRTTLTAPSTGSSTFCDGFLLIDMNHFAHGSLGGSPAPFLLQPGTVVHCQFWSFGLGSNLLSDGLVYVVGA